MAWVKRITKNTIEVYLEEICSTECVWKLDSNCTNLIHKKTEYFYNQHPLFISKTDSRCLRLTFIAKKPGSEFLTFHCYDRHDCVKKIREYTLHLIVSDDLSIEFINLIQSTIDDNWKDRPEISQTNSKAICITTKTNYGPGYYWKITETPSFLNLREIHDNVKKDSSELLHTSAGSCLTKTEVSALKPLSGIIKIGFFYMGSTAPEKTISAYITAMPDLSLRVDAISG